MTEMQPQFAPQKNAEQAKATYGDTPDYTITLDFDGGGNVTLDLGGLGVVTGDDEVDVYSAQGTPPTTRQTGPTNRRAAYTSPTGRLGKCFGGVDAVNQTFWVQVQVTRGTTTITSSGSLAQQAFPANGVSLPLTRLT